ncbi:MAG: type II toxin-antitoxin system RelE/ParE family toxin [Tardiphaga sp.]
MKVIVSRQADRDLIEIYVYLHQQSPQSAERIAADLKRCIADLAIFPHRGAPRSVIATGVRCAYVHPYQLFYVVQPHHIEVLRVLHGSRDTKREFPE